MTTSLLHRAIIAAAVLVLAGGFPTFAARAQEAQPAPDAAVAGGSETSAAEASETDASGTESIDMTQALALAREGSAEGIALLSRFLYVGTTDKTQIKDRATRLIRALSGDVVEVQAAAESIVQAAEYALSGARVTRFDIDESYRPPADAIAFDFGTADTEVLPGFERVTARDKRVEGDGDVESLRRPSGKPVISSGILGIRKFRTAVPNGTYRVVIMTDDLGEWKNLTKPLGDRLRVNNRVRPVVTDRPDQWTGQRYLGSFDEAKVDRSRPLSGGMVVIEVKVTNGFFDLELEGDERTFLAGLLLEPIDEEEYAEFDPDLVDIAQEIGQVLAEVVTEAGENVPVEDLEVSPS